MQYGNAHFCRRACGCAQNWPSRIILAAQPALCFQPQGRQAPFAQAAVQASWRSAFAQTVRAAFAAFSFSQKNGQCAVCLDLCQCLADCRWLPVCFGGSLSRWAVAAHFAANGFEKPIAEVGMGGKFGYEFCRKANSSKPSRPIGV
jgi:hypothetical protein